jgi:hypothetical protein
MAYFHNCTNDCNLYDCCKVRDLLVDTSYFYVLILTLSGIFIFIF